MVSGVQLRFSTRTGPSLNYGAISSAPQRVGVLSHPSNLRTRQKSKVCGVHPKREMSLLI